MDSGKLDQRIRVERLVQTDDGAGGSEEGWSSVGEVWAKVVPLSGSEQVQADRQSGVVDYEITIWNGFTVTRRRQGRLADQWGYGTEYSPGAGSWLANGVRHVGCRKRGGGVTRRRSRLSGVNNLRRTLRRLPEDATAEVVEAVSYGAELVHADALTKAAVDTGDMVSQISHKQSRDGLSARIGFRGKKANRKAFYAKFLEFGTIQQLARPFLQPALEQNRRHIFDRIRTAVTRAMRRASRG